MAILALATALHLAASCAPGVAPETLLSVAATETGYSQRGQAFTAPYSIGINGQGGGMRIYDSAADATAAASALIARGITNLDLGIAQINLKAGHLQRRGMSVADAFDPCISFRVGGEVLAECYGRTSGLDEQARLKAAAGCYNTGSTERGAGYSARVWQAAARVVPAIRVASLGAEPVTPAVAAVPQPLSNPFVRPSHGRAMTFNHSP